MQFGFSVLLYASTGETLLLLHVGICLDKVEEVEVSTWSEIDPLD